MGVGGTRIAGLGLLAAALIAGCTSGDPASPAASPAPTGSTAPATEPPRMAPEHPIQVDGDRFVDTRTGVDFRVRGVNYFRIVPAGGGLQDRFLSPAVFDAAVVRRDFTTLAEHGYTTVRIFLDSCSGGPDCIAVPGGSGLNPRYLDVIAQTLAITKETGVFLLTSNDIPDDGGYSAIANRGNSTFFPGYRNTAFLTTAGADAAAAYWDDLLCGLVQRRAAFEAVLAWSILNEQWVFRKQPPLSLREGTVTGADGKRYDLSSAGQRRRLVLAGVRHYIDTIAEVIRRHDPHGLVTMGFFAPQFPNRTTIGGDWYVDTAPLLSSTDLDFFDFHAYPGSDIGIAEIAENFGMPFDRKPVVMGEVGTFIDRYDSAEAAGIATQDWIADSCDLGFDGWLYWGFLRAPEAIGDATWGLTDANGYLLTALSTQQWPDPCTPTLVDPNLAADRPVRVSRALPAEPGSAGVDGNPGTQWGAGTHAPQWIEVSLAEPSTVAGIRLLVAQFPAGQTVHQVAIRTNNGSLRVLHTFSGNTAGGDVLATTFDTPLRNVTDVRITTTRSPSWVAWSEIEVLAR